MNNFIELFEYNVWANRRQLAQVKELTHEDYVIQLTPISSDVLNSMRLALLHLLKADWAWNDLWSGHNISEYPTTWDDFNIDEIADVWLPLQDNIRHQLTMLFPERSETELEFSDGDETTKILRCYQSVNLVITHATYYRGQIANMIEELGIPPIQTTLFHYYTRSIHA